MKITNFIQSSEASALELHYILTNVASYEERGKEEDSW